MKRDSLRLYAVTDSYWLNGRQLKDCVEEALIGGATMIQLREKELNDEDFLKLALEIKAVCKKYNVPFIINDNLDVFLKCDADGIHVGQDDLDAKYVRSVIGSNKILGVSARNIAEAKKAIEDGADYLGVGAMFKTATKTDALDVTIDELKKITSLNIPTVIIGGINLNNIYMFKDTSIDGISVVSAIFAQENITAATKQLLEETKKWF